MNNAELRLRALMLALALSVGATVSVLAQAKPPEPLSIARQGYLFAGGKYSTVNGRQVMSGQLYAEFQIPSRQTHPWPIVMIHGGSQSGTNFTGTPDGREGWAQFFLRRGYPVYVVDQPGRGRAAYEPDLTAPRLPSISKPPNGNLPRRSATTDGRRRISTRNGRGRACRAIRSSTSSTPRKCLRSRTSRCSSH